MRSDTNGSFLISRCMKEGMVAETGTHEQLIELKGEYAKLYNIQASAFTGKPRDSFLSRESLITGRPLMPDLIEYY